MVGREWGWGIVGGVCFEGEGLWDMFRGGGGMINMVSLRTERRAGIGDELRTDMVTYDTPGRKQNGMMQ